MPHNAQQRITDTLHCLQFTLLGPAGARGPAHQLAQNFITARFPAGAALVDFQATRWPSCRTTRCSSRARPPWAAARPTSSPAISISTRVATISSSWWQTRRRRGPRPSLSRWRASRPSIGPIRYVQPLVPPGPHNIATTDFTQMTAIELSGANPMVTTQFTGCAFCMGAHGGHVYCAHVAPFVPGMQLNTTGTILANRLLVPGNAQFQNAGGIVPTVYGRNAGSGMVPGGYNIGGGGGAGTWMTIVGFPVGGTYRIYAQTVVNEQIMVAEQIYQ